MEIIEEPFAIVVEKDHIKVYGIVKSIAHSHEIKHAIDDVINNHKSVKIHFCSTFILTSSVIGYLYSCIQHGGKKIKVFVYSQELMDYILDLHMEKNLNVTYVGQ